MNQGHTEAGGKGPGPEAFPVGGGRMGGRVRELDWSVTPLGPIVDWPPSLRALVNTVLEMPLPAVLYWGPELTAIHNDAYRALLGRKPDALGRSLREIWPEALDMVGAVVEKALAGEASHFEGTPFTLLRHGYAEQAWFDWAFTPVRDESGAVAGFLNTTVETTAVVLAQRRQAFMLELSDRLRGLADPETILSEASDMLGERLGATRAFYVELDEDSGHVIIGSDYRDPATRVGSMAGRYPLDELAETLIARARCGATVIVADASSDAVLDDAERAAFDTIGARAAVVAPLVKQGRLLAMLAVVQDEPRPWSTEEVRQVEETAERTWAAVERGRVEGALQNATATAEEASAAKGRLLAVLSHELRTPLTGVIGSVELLESESSTRLSTRHQQAVERIRSSAWHMVSMIDEILTLARAESGKEQVRREHADVAHIVREAMSLVEPQAEHRGLALRAEGVARPASTWTDAGKVRHILTNLLGNAVKFTTEGEVVVSLDRSAADHLAIHVRDTGPGIAPEDQERIFEPFVRLHGSQSARAKDRGAGLGLAICRRFARLVGGDVTVESAVGAGSTFTVILPVENASE